MSVDRDTANDGDLIKCPACDVWLPEYDFDRQRVHLLANHPALVRNRVEEAKRWDGWEDSP